MKNIYAGIAAFFLVASSSIAGEAASWRSAYQFPHFTQEYAGCENVALGQMRELFLTQGLPASAFTTMAKSFYADLRPKELVRPFAQADTILIGLNLRWSGNALCRNPVLICQSTDDGTCSEMSSVATKHVLQPLWFDGRTVIAERDNFAPGNLNPGQPDFVLSNDKGTSWTSLNSPVPCGEPGTLCRLIPQSASRYFLMATRLLNDAWSDISIHATADGGKSWTLLIDKWRGMNDPTAVALAEDGFVGVQAASAEFVTLSRFKALDNQVEEVKTSIRTSAWSPRFDGQVLAFDREYLVRLNAASNAVVPNHVGIFLVPAMGQTASAKLIWQARDVMIGDFQSAEGVIAIKTWNPRSVITRGKFAEQIHYSRDGGETWQVSDVPAELLGGAMRLADRKVWMFTAGAVKYLAVAG